MRSFSSTATDRQHGNRREGKRDEDALNSNVNSQGAALDERLGALFVRTREGTVDRATSQFGRIGTK